LERSGVGGGFAIVVPVGPSAAEAERFRDLIASVEAYEPGACLCVAIDSAPRPRVLLPRPGCRLVTLARPYDGAGEPLLGRLSAAILLALDVIRKAGPVDFILRLDTDALVIAPFAAAVRDFLRRHPHTGMLGTLGCTCRRDEPYYGCESRAVSDVMLAGHRRIRAHARRAIANGYTAKEYCQGGAYVLPFRTVERMARRRYLESPEIWVEAPVPEDVMMGMYTRAVGLRSMDFSLRGQPFANHYRGLPYAPRELVRRGHAIIHSVKRDAEFTEREIRRYFRVGRVRAALALGRPGGLPHKELQ
jgi:hypothetical protein